jgi:Flp pilus assembly protein TadG
MMKRVRRVVSDTSGQAAITMAALVFLFAFLGIAVVDFGIWYDDRRDAQADADAIALAGAQELPDFENDSAARANAEARALEWATSNGVAASEVTITVVRTCFSAQDAVHTGVRATVRRKPHTIFVSILPGIESAVVVETTALACSGRPVELTGLLPWAIETEGSCFTNDLDPLQRVPIYGELCELAVGGQGGQSGDVGQLGFTNGGACEDGNGSAAQYEENIVFGTDVRCSSFVGTVPGDSVSSNTGVNLGATLKGLERRLNGDGLCDGVFATAEASPQTTLNQHTAAWQSAGYSPFLHAPAGANDDIDDFREIWTPPAGGMLAEELTPIDCDGDQFNGSLGESVRAADVIVVADVGVDDGTGCNGSGASPHCYQVLAFAHIYLEGCSNVQQGFSPTCDLQGGGNSLTVWARFVKPTYRDNVTDIGLSAYGETYTVLKE